jgi:GT2 family glycosyltransferase
LSIFEKPHVGVVDAKLLYANEKTQHIGVVHNGGKPDHVRRWYPRDEAGYFFSTCGVRNYMGVTGACMMTPTRLYESVGGYSDELAINYNDVDYCMKVRALGLYILYAPRAELFHFESQSRRVPRVVDETNIYQKNWACDTVSDL